MQIIHKKKGSVKLKVENLDDLWYLSQIIDPGDLLSGKTTRKIKKESGSNIKVDKKTITLLIKVEKVEFHKTTMVLRVSGTIEEEKEDITKGSHHTINLKEGSFITLTKEEWLKFHKERLNQATKQRMAKILICVLDREEAVFALTKKPSYELISNIKGDVQKKEERAVAKGEFYKQVSEILVGYNKRFKPTNIILASPAFFKEDFMKQLKEDSLKKIIVLATCSSINENGIKEVLKRTEVRHVLKRDQITKEIELVEELLGQISKNNLATYGLREVKKAVDAGAVEKLLITDKKILKAREEEKYNDLEILMRLVEQTKGEIHIISSDHEGGQKLDGLTGIAALLRYKLQY